MPSSLRWPKEWLFYIRSVREVERDNEDARMVRGVTHSVGEWPLRVSSCARRHRACLGDVTQHGAHRLQRVQDPRLGQEPLQWQFPNLAFRGGAPRGFEVRARLTSPMRRQMLPRGDPGVREKLRQGASSIDVCRRQDRYGESVRRQGSVRLAWCRRAVDASGR